MSIRDKIAEIVTESHKGVSLGIPNDLWAADAILAALPDMIPDLVWRDITAGFGTTDYFIMPVPSSGEFRVYGIKGDYDNSAQYPDLDSAQAAANTHNRAAFKAMLTGETK